jgi:hypothetical protein
VRIVSEGFALTEFSLGYEEPRWRDKTHSHNALHTKGGWYD